MYENCVCVFHILRIDSAMNTARGHRLFGYNLERDSKKESEKTILRFKDNENVRKGISIKGQVVTLDFSKANSLYMDDALALIRDGIVVLDESMPHQRNKEAVKFIQKALEQFDLRAVERHGYSGDQEEQSLTAVYYKESAK